MPPAVAPVRPVVPSNPLLGQSSPSSVLECNVTIDLRKPAQIPTTASCKLVEINANQVAQSTPVTITRAYRAKPGLHEYLTARGTLIRAKGNQAYNPKVTTRRVVPHDRVLYAYLTKTDPGGVASFDGGEVQHPQHVEKMNAAEVAEKITAYLQAHPRIATDLGIKNIYNLSPNQAAKLVDRLTQEILSYHRAAWKQSSPMVFTDKAIEIQRELDAKPLEDFFKPGSKGLCRTYAEVAQGLFIVVKQMQNPKTSQLVNTWGKVQDGYQHNWLALYTVQPDGVVVVTQIDPTWSDSRSDGTDYTFYTDDIRDYFRIKTLLRDTGNRPIKALLQKLDLGEWPVNSTDIVSKDDLGSVGGIAGFSGAIDALPAAARVNAFLLLSSDLRDELQKYREANGKTEIADHHPHTNG